MRGGEILGIIPELLRKSIHGFSSCSLQWLSREKPPGKTAGSKRSIPKSKDSAEDAGKAPAPSRFKSLFSNFGVQPNSQALRDESDTSRPSQIFS